jgi:hypothetical protein
MWPIQCTESPRRRHLSGQPRQTGRIFYLVPTLIRKSKIKVQNDISIQLCNYMHIDDMLREQSIDMYVVQLRSPEAPILLSTQSLL